MKRMQNISAWALEWVERMFLYSHGWQRRKNGYYDPPASYQAGSRRQHKQYTRSHAINSQKQYVYNPMHGGSRTDPDLSK